MTDFFRFNNNNVFKPDNYKSISNDINNEIDLKHPNEKIIKKLHKNIISLDQMTKDLLTFEFLFYEPTKKISDIYELMSLCKKKLKRYQYVVGGHFIEDIDWINCDKTYRIKLKDTQLGIYNTCELSKSYDEHKSFLKTFVKHIKKYSNNIHVNYKIIEDIKNEIAWIVLVLEHKNH